MENESIEFGARIRAVLHTIMGCDYLNIEESEKMILVKITSAKQNKKSTHHRTQSVMGLLRMQTNTYAVNNTNTANKAILILEFCSD